MTFTLNLDFKKKLISTENVLVLNLISPKTYVLRLFLYLYSKSLLSFPHYDTAKLLVYLKYIKLKYNLHIFKITSILYKGPFTSYMMSAKGMGESAEGV